MNITYLPIGDSYTIGEGVLEEKNFPNQLVNRLTNKGISIELLGNEAVTGFTTQDVINGQLKLIPSLQPNFCTLLIGVNDWVQEVSAQYFEKRLIEIIQTIIKQVKGKLLLLTIPDFSVSATGNKYGKGRNITEGITQFNTIIKKQAAAFELSVIDIFPLSQKQTDNSYFAPDQLHPSGKAYQEWVEKMLPTVATLVH
ncbi:MAG: SGNH/GDSL hydrolase family protein [Cyclobacteriaceae bacterium]